MLGACPRLERIEVHIGISDYFMNVDDDVSKRKYSRIVKKLEVFIFRFMLKIKQLVNLVQFEIRNSCQCLNMTGNSRRTKFL